MFTENTVFILGAGASWHYGYPTGEELVKKVIKKAQEYADALAPNVTHSYRKEYGDYSVKIYDKEIPKFQHNKDRDVIRNNCYLLANRLRAANTLVIDDFLSRQNVAIQEIGKFLIAWVILECESFYLQKLREEQEIDLNPNRIIELKPFNSHDDWCRFLLHEIIYGCEKSSDGSGVSGGKTLVDNQVRFITFNYDVSLEQMLFKGLMAHTDYFTSDEINQFFSHDRLIHMYGAVREKPVDDFVPISTDWANKKDPEFERIYQASRQIKTIEGIDKQDDAIFKMAQKAVEKADRIIILGFGFDRRNCERLGLSGFHDAKYSRHISFTNRYDTDKINKTVNNVFGLNGYFYRGGNNFLYSNEIMNSDEDIRTFFERSTVDVYRALAEDIDLSSK